MVALRGDESRIAFGARLDPPVKEDTVGKWERGAINIPYLSLCSIAEAHGLSLSEFLSHGPTPPPKTRAPSPAEIALFVLGNLKVTDAQREVIKFVLESDNEAVMRLLKHTIRERNSGSA